LVSKFLNFYALLHKSTYSQNKSIILGVDPGTAITGYAIIEAANPKPLLLTAGVMFLARQGFSHGQKLDKVYSRMGGLIQEFQPTALAIETPFYGKNIQATLKLGRMQGVVIAAALANSLSYYEYAPGKIKKAVCGQGNASKAQIAGLLLNLFPDLKSKYSEQFYDAYDALACALCHYYQTSSFTPMPPIKNQLFSSKSVNKSVKTSAKWAQFIQNNPDRIKKNKTKA
jgi:crossover junction endodeoxyribonuclease RuvC